MKILKFEALESSSVQFLKLLISSANIFQFFKFEKLSN